MIIAPIGTFMDEYTGPEGIDKVIGLGMSGYSSLCLRQCAVPVPVCCRCG